MKYYTSLVSLALLALGIVGGGVSTAAAQPYLAPPDMSGPFNVGVTIFSAQMSDERLTKIQVYYPTLEASDKQSKYTIFTSAGSYQLRSPSGAVADAQVAPGNFPLIVHDHGGGGVGSDGQRVDQFPLHESMASHGFITAVALHSNNPITRVRDLSMVIDMMLVRSVSAGDLFEDSIDSDKIGISGISAGGGSAIGVAGGWSARGLIADPRIKAMVLYEPIVLSLDDAANISLPYLVMGGMQNKNGLAVPALFDATRKSSPRIYVLSPNATHFNYFTGMGSAIDQTREAALLADPTLPEPLTHLTATNAAAARAYELWNLGEITFPFLGFGAGSGRNFCDRVGVNSVRSLDTSPHDGFTDAPPFMATDAFTLQPAIPEEIMVPMIKLYTISFWKTFLQDDLRYMRYLAPGYAQQNDLEALVEFE